MIHGNQQDELIFDYLEGNLSAAETEALQILQDESELFDREVRLWQNTFVKTELPEIGDLEQKLLIDTTPATGKIAGRVSAVVLMVMTSIIIPSAHNEIVMLFPEKAGLPVSPPAQEPGNFETIPACVEERVTAITRKRVDITSEKVRFATSASVVVSAVQLLDLPLHPLVGPVSPRLPERTVQQTIFRPAPVKKWSKRELRLIRKMRLQNDNVRRQIEFQKGEVPYVVPLGNNNF